MHSSWTTSSAGTQPHLELGEGVEIFKSKDKAV